MREQDEKRVVLWEPERQYTLDDVRREVAERQAQHVAIGIGPGTRVMLVCESTADAAMDAAALRATRAAVVPVSGTLTPSERAALTDTLALTHTVSHGAVVRNDRKSQPEQEIGARDAREDAVLGLLSSGSTGRPKLVWRSAAQVTAALEIFNRSIGVCEGDRILAVIPPEHSYGYQNLLLNATAPVWWDEASSSPMPPVTALVFPRTQHPRSVARHARTAAVTIFPGAPAFLDMIARAASPDDMPDALRMCISVGTALSARVHRDFTGKFGVLLWQSYGASEAGPVCVNKTGSAKGELVDLGGPCSGVNVRVIGEAGDEAPDGEAGELVIESPAVGLGYEGATDGASRIESGRFFTGDLAVRDGDTLRFVGRRKLLIAAAGNKVDPLEVEEALRAHPAVADVAVVPHAGRDSSELVKALVVRRGDVDAVELMDFCSTRLAAFKVPRLVEFREALPRNAMGKLQREKLGS